ncbi:MAG: hypothetical protein WCI48_05650 [Bacteroidota bacterium]
MPKHKLNRLIMLMLILALNIPGASGQEHRVNQKKINKERARKQQKAEKEYHDAVKRHKKIQSKNTRGMMRQSRKESGSLTPVKR